MITAKLVKDVKKHDKQSHHDQAWWDFNLRADVGAIQSILALEPELTDKEVAEKAAEIRANQEALHVRRHRRLAACVSFCEGKSTEWLEQHGTIDAVMARDNTPPRGRNDCPACGAGMLLLATQNKKICVDCRVEYPWELTGKQKPLVEAQR